MSRLHRPWLLATTLVVTVTVSVVALPLRAQMSFEGRGRIAAVNHATGRLTLDHDPIPGLMPGGRTVFPVGRPDLLRAAQVGDAVRFVLEATTESHGVLTVSRLDAPPAGRGVPVEAPADVSPIQDGRTPSAALPSLGVLLAAGVAVLSAIGLAAYSFGRRVHEIRQSLSVMARTQAQLRQDLGAMARALEEIGEAMHARPLQGFRRLTFLVEASREGDPRQRAGATSRAPVLFVVRHGETELFRTLQERLEAPGAVHVTWDRRGGDRRTRHEGLGPERRRADRRRALPRTWATMGVIAPHPAEPPG